MVPDLHVVSGSDDGLDEFVEGAGGVHVVPQDLSIVGVVSSTEPLLTSVVHEWNTS